MSDEGLRSVEGLRRTAVERARVQLALARAALRESEARVLELAAAVHAADSRLRTLREAAVHATDVRELRWTSDSTRAARHDVEQLMVRSRVVSGEHALLLAHVRACEQTLRAAEVGRRVVERTLERQAAQAELREVLREEEALEDDLRARAR